MMKEELQAVEDLMSQDFPHVTNTLKSHLQGRFSLRNTVNELAGFKADGFSESYCLGWLQGINAVMEYLDLMTTPTSVIDEE